MSWFRFLRRKQSDIEIAREIEHHLAQEIEENLARGMSREESTRQAHLKFGSPQRIRENLRQHNTIAPLEIALRNTRYAARTLSRAPGFTLIAITIMALGIGANSALFMLVRSILLQPLPYQNPDRLVMLYQHDPSAKDQDNYVASGNFADWQKTAHSFSAMAMVTPWASHDLAGTDGFPTEKVATAWCSGNIFTVLGAQAAYGRTFNEQDDRREANATVVLSWGFWQRRFGGKLSILGQPILFNNRPYIVIGIMPRGFDFPLSQIEAWTPAHNEGSARLLASRDDHEFQVIGRLKPGVSLQQAVSELSTIQKHIAENNPGLPIEPQINGRILLDDLVGSTKTPLYAMLAATGCLLLIACLNVAGLTAARSISRNREAAVRSALGGSRLRLMGEQLSESLLLATAAGFIGIVLAYAATRWLRSARPDMVRIDGLHFDGAVALFVALITIATGILAGLLPALGWRNQRLLSTFQDVSRTHSAGAGRIRLRAALLSLQIALTVVLLAAAGVLLKSYEKLRFADLGCTTKNVLTMQVTLSDGRFNSPEKQIAYFSDLLQRAKALPGVEQAGLVTVPPGGGWWEDAPVAVVEHSPVPKAAVLDPISRAADPDYFSALQIPLLRGRTFTPNDRLQNSNVVILSQKAARQFFLDEDPIGKHLRLAHQPDVPPLEVIGIVGDTRFHVSEDIWPMIYQPVLSGRFSQLTLVLRTTASPLALARPLQKIASNLDPALPLPEILTMDQILNRSTRSARFDSTLVVVFAIIALTLATAGLFAAQSYVVTQRTNEIGIRMALGAQRGQVIRLILRNGVTIVSIGLLLGFAASCCTVRFIGSMLYGANPIDLPVFLGAGLLLFTIAMLACAIPAWRAACLSPGQTLRAE